MNDNLAQIKMEVYDNCLLEISYFKNELESKEYDACRFELNGLKIINRTAKITPKKLGQFVTFWKRNGNGPIEPFDESDHIDFFVINVRSKKRFGQFVIPKSILIKKGILSSEKKEGKRAFRLYPNWDTVQNKQAIRTQKWQLDYFYEINSSLDYKKVLGLYEIENHS